MTETGAGENPPHNDAPGELRRPPIYALCRGWMHSDPDGVILGHITQPRHVAEAGEGSRAGPSSVSYPPLPTLKPGSEDDYSKACAEVRYRNSPHRRCRDCGRSPRGAFSGEGMTSPTVGHALAGDGEEPGGAAGGPHGALEGGAEGGAAAATRRAEPAPRWRRGVTRGASLAKRLHLQPGTGSCCDSDGDSAGRQAGPG